LLIELTMPTSTNSTEDPTILPDLLAASCWRLIGRMTLSSLLELHSSLQSLRLRSYNILCLVLNLAYVDSVSPISAAKP